MLAIGQDLVEPEISSKPAHSQNSDQIPPNSAPDAPWISWGSWWGLPPSMRTSQAVSPSHVQLLEMMQAQYDLGCCCVQGRSLDLQMTHEKEWPSDVHSPSEVRTRHVVGRARQPLGSARSAGAIGSPKGVVRVAQQVDHRLLCGQSLGPLRSIWGICWPRLAKPEPNLTR